MNEMISNQEIYDSNWPAWMEMKVHGPAQPLASLPGARTDQRDPQRSSD